MAPSSRSRRLPACELRPLADLAGRSVALSIDVPPSFDAPGAPALDPHHKLLAPWAASREGTAKHYTRPEARRHIEREFDAAVLEILKPLELADLRVALLVGDPLPPAIVVVCDSIGQLDLRWIEKSNVLSNTLVGSIAPLRWRATAYRALESALLGFFPIFGFEDLMQELSGYYWDGEIDDERARQTLIDYHGHDPEDLESMTLPSQVRAKRPDWMLAENATALKNLPAGLRTRVRALRAARQAVDDAHTAGSAWTFSWDGVCDYLPHMEDSGSLPPMTIVPFDELGQEIDTVCQHCMETSFMDVAGLCPLTDASSVEAWFTSLKLGVDLLLAAQALIDIDPCQEA